MTPKKTALKISRIFGSCHVLAAMAALALITGCASRAPGGAAPVEDRGSMSSRNQSASPTPAPVGSIGSIPTGTNGTTAKLPPGIENSGKPGYYSVRPGDTMIRIGLETGQSWRDIARWNNIDNPNILEVGQVIRIIPPGTAAVAAAPLPPSSAPAGEGVVTRPVSSPTAITGTSLPAPSAGASTRTASAPSVTPLPVPAASAPLPPASSPSDEDIAWIWPVTGGANNIVARFDEVSNKGVGISGKLGDPILAAGDGRVVYAGAGLRGYGNLVILKHNNTYLTAYAHNQTLLVKEDQTVRKGQKIAEMGNSDSDRTKLHFEIRRQGKPVDPLRFLPR